MVAGDVHGAEISQQGEGHDVGSKQLPGEALDVVGRDRFDLTGDLLDSEEAAEVHLLAGKVGHSAAGAFESDDDVALELVLGALELSLADGLLFETREFLEGKLEEFFG